MRTTFAFTALLASWTAAVIAAPASDEGFIGKESADDGCDRSELKEIVVLYTQGNTSPEIEALKKACAFDETDIKQRLDNPGFRGLIVNVCPSCMDSINALDEVDMVEETVEIKTFAQKTGSPWGLQRISNVAGASGSPQGTNFVYSFDDEQLGAGVDIYVVDTGVRTSHKVFQDAAGKSRATAGFSFTDNGPVDGDGHGTHCAGTAGGAKFGVAQGANIIAVKVLGDDGSGTSTNTIAGMDWVIKQHNERKTQPGFKGSVMSMSWGLTANLPAVNSAVRAASGQGIHISVAAGNEHQDACGSTPALNGGANSAVVSVGAVNIQNEISSFSNAGKCVDIYGPGESILSSWSTGDQVVNFLSGTSMACPHVSGVMAYLIAKDTTGKLGQDPAALKAELLANAFQNAVIGNTNGSANLLLSNGVDGGVTRRVMRGLWVPEHSGSAASQARDIVGGLDKTFTVHSTDSPLRF